MKTAQLAFIKVPTHLAPSILDSSIPLPVEVNADESLNSAELTIEMVISGMLRVVAEGEPAKHLSYYRNCVLALRPEILHELGGAAITKASCGDFELAREIIAALKGLFPASPQVLFLAATVLEAEADALTQSGGEDDARRAESRAEIAYKEALAVEAPLDDALFNAAYFYKKRRNYIRAREYFLEYAVTGGDPEKKKRARAESRRIEQQRLDDEHYTAAYNLISSGEEEKGMEELRVFLEKNPVVSNAWFLLGWALRRRKRWEDGAAAFQKARELGAADSETRNELAICLIELGRFDEARRELEAALAADNENITIISNLGMLALRRGDNTQAERFFRTVLEIAPNDPLALQFAEHSARS